MLSQERAALIEEGLPATEPLSPASPLTLDEDPEVVPEIPDEAGMLSALYQSDSSQGLSEEEAVERGTFQARGGVDEARGRTIAWAAEAGTGMRGDDGSAAHAGSEFPEFSGSETVSRISHAIVSLLDLEPPPRLRYTALPGFLEDTPYYEFGGWLQERLAASPQS